MTKRNLLLAAVGGALLSVCGPAPAQYRPPGLPDPGRPKVTLSDFVVPIPKVAAQAEPTAFPPGGLPAIPSATVPPPAGKPDDLTIDQLLDAVEAVRAQKAALEKQEQALLKVIGEKAEKLKARINKVGAGTLLDPIKPDQKTDALQDESPGVKPPAGPAAPRK